MSGVPDWYYRQAAAVPYRATESGLELLLITTRGGKRWIFPKGVIDPHLDAVGAALQEAYEEAGVRGEVTGPPLGEYEYEKWGGTCTVTVFALRVTEETREWPERDKRTRRWASPDVAADLIDETFRGFIPLLLEALA